MSLLVISGVVIRLGGRTLLDGADLTVDPGRRIGLVGRNGAGKSTLLRAIMGDIALDGGDIRLASGARIATVRQEAPEGPASLLDTVLEGDPERLACSPRPRHADPLRLAEIHERLRAIGADAAPARAATILAGLGFDEAAQARPVSSFSGGWRMRVALATALFANPDLLLLDEPTNHLDLEATLWLEGWLARFPGAALVVSHDRGLLDRAVEAIAHLDRGKIVADARRLRRIRPHPHRKGAAADPRGRADRGGTGAYPILHRPLPLQGQQGAPGPGADQGTGAAAADRNVIEDAPTRFASPNPPASLPRSWRWTVSTWL